MATKRISELPDATLPLSGDELFELTQGLTSKKCTPADLFSIIEGILNQRQNFSQERISPVEGINNFVFLIGDSITQGVGATVSGSTEWASVLQKHWNSRFGRKDRNVIGNLGMLATYPGLYGITTSGTFAAGNKGPSKKSIVLQPGAYIQFSGDHKIIDVTYQASPSAGKLQFYEGASLLTTLDCSGTAQNDKSSFGSIPEFSASYTVRRIQAIDAPVEITTLRQFDIAGVSRVVQFQLGVSGETTDYFNDAALLASAKGLCQDFGAEDHSKTYVISLGTNDIYSETDFVPLADYIDNLTDMINTLAADLTASNVRIMLHVPPYPGPGRDPQEATHEEFKQAIYKLAADKNCTVIDHTLIDYYNSGLYDPDKLHPNDSGHNIWFQSVYKELTFSTPFITQYRDWLVLGQEKRYSILASGELDGGAFIVYNAKYNGSNWNRIDPTKPAVMLGAYADQLTFGQAEPGTGSFTFKTRKLVSANRSATMELGDKTIDDVSIQGKTIAGLQINCQINPNDNLYYRTDTTKSCALMYIGQDGIMNILTAGPGTGAITFYTSGMLMKEGTPATASATGKKGEIKYDATYLYICTATNTWRRIPHSSW